MESQEVNDYVCGERWNYTKDEEFLDLFMKQCPLVLQMIKRMFTMEKYTVATAIIKESEAVYLVIHKENSAAHDTHSIKVEADDTMDCRCSVKMGHPVDTCLQYLKHATSRLF